MLNVNFLDKTLKHHREAEAVVEAPAFSRLPLYFKATDYSRKVDRLKTLLKLM